jgi:hypothetical protein
LVGGWFPTATDCSDRFGVMTPLQLLVEGFAALGTVSSLTLLVLGVATGLSARAAAIPALVSFGAGATALSWLRLGGRGGDFPDQLVAAALVAAVLIIMSPLISRPDFAAVPGGLLAGGAAAELWTPEAGEALSQLLADLPSLGTVSGLGWMALYLLGLLSPLWLLALAHHLTPDFVLDRLEPSWSVIGGAVLVLGGMAAALGIVPDLLDRLGAASMAA